MRRSTADKMKELIDIAAKVSMYNGQSVDVVTALLDITREQLQLALERISMVGLPPYTADTLIDAYIDGDTVTINDAPGMFQRPVRLQKDEAIALLLAARVAEAADGTADGALGSALDKIRGVINSAEAAQIDDVSRRIELAPEQKYLVHILNTLKPACGRSKVNIEYYAASQHSVTERVICPYGLIYYVDQWYCVGYCELRGDIRVFRLDRMKMAVATDEPFATPDDFDLDDFRRNRLFRFIDRPHEVTLRFAGPAAARVSEQWADRSVKNKDGSVCVKFKIDRLENFVSTVLQYGPGVSVVSPPELAQMVRDTALKALRHYCRVNDEKT